MTDTITQEPQPKESFAKKLSNAFTSSNNWKKALGYTALFGIGAGAIISGFTISMALASQLATAGIIGVLVATYIIIQAGAYMIGSASVGANNMTVLSTA